MEAKMKDTLELSGRVFETRTAICERLGVSFMALKGWRLRGVLPKAVQIGRSNYYPRDELDRRLAATGA
jgi:hypothetical protein